MICSDNSLLSSKWLARLAQFSKLIVGFSGGLDSTVLVHALAAHPGLKAKLVAVHINHGISPHALSWQKHCHLWCQNHGIKFITKSVQFDRTANIEEHARLARYEVFSSLLTTNDCLILAHHQNDQAETVLLQLVRGAGIDGLAAMTSSSRLGLGTMARPLLTHSRAQLEQYTLVHQLTWIEDESNENTVHARNYLRHKIVPLLIDRWPGVVRSIARTATHCQQAKNNLASLATSDCLSSLADSDSPVLPIELLANLNFDRCSNVLRRWLQNNHIQVPPMTTFNRVIDELIYARADADPQVSWGDVVIRRYQNSLYLDRKQLVYLPDSIEWSTFPKSLTIGSVGKDQVESEINLVAKKVSEGLVLPPDAKMLIRFRQGGEEIFLHGQNKKLKKMFQEWGIPPWLRTSTPLIYINNVLAAVVGYAVSDSFFSKNSPQSWLLSVKTEKKINTQAN